MKLLARPWCAEGSPSIATASGFWARTVCKSVLTIAGVASIHLTVAR
nr:hypothetical protein [Nocardia salmonicida]